MRNVPLGLVGLCNDDLPGHIAPTASNETSIIALSIL